MSQPCAITKCIRASRGLCDCCKQNLCLQHLNEHNASLISQLNPLTDEINTLGDRLKALDIQKIVGNCRQQLEQWCGDCHQKIDRFFEQKCQELHRLTAEKVDKQREELSRIQSDVGELIREQEATRQNIDSLTSTIRQFQDKMNDIERTCFQINTRPLVIDASYIHITDTNDHMIDLTALSTVYKIIKRSSGDYRSMANNDRFLLMHHKSNLCFVDREMNVVKTVLWPYEQIHDMCWSSTIDRFIINEENNVFLIDENTLMIDKVDTINKRQWNSCTCSDTSLFLLTREFSSTVTEFSLLPSIEVAKQWKSPHTCATDEFIDSIAYGNKKLALMVRNRSTRSTRIELKSADIFNNIWSLPLDIVYNRPKVFRSCSLPCEEWLLVDYENERFLQVTKDGNIKATILYNPAPHFASLFGPNMLAVSKSGGITFHLV